MTFDLAAAKARLNIVDTSKDVEIQNALDISQGIVENYLDRKLDDAAEVETFYSVSNQTLQVRRFPITAVNSITEGVAAQVDLEKGIIYFRNALIAEAVEVDYQGGYAVLPPDLEEAMWQVFDYIWLKVDNPGGSVAAGAIDRITIPDVGTISYATNGDGVPEGPFTGVAYMLDSYRRLSC
ncbi:hypothetical protein DRH27_00510 [Candidatus Falkowbacteria bacterium]|nr:MAG: hypothetical protein DRH27_00510 [Candidatus Falkowbacteria bacterium]